MDMMNFGGLRLFPVRSADSVLEDFMRALQRSRRTVALLWRAVILLLALTARFAAVSDLACADDDPAGQLPKSGFWVRYGFELTGTNIVEPIAGHITLRFLDQVTEDGVRCRWVEQKEVITEGADQGEYLIKSLIPESALLTKEFPGDHAVRSWYRIPGHELKITTQPAGSFRNLFYALPGPRGTLVADEKDRRDVEHRHGKLKGAVAYRGTARDTILGGVVRKGEQHKKLTYWLHPELPSCIADGHVESSEFHNDEFVARYVHTFQLQDFGMNARSALPDNN
jgi:hypothetical protein